MEVPNNGRNSTVEVATVEVASIEIATMEDSIIWKLETIQDSIMDGRNSTMENSIMEIATIEIATMEDSVAWKLETIEDSIMEVSNERWKLQRWKIQLQKLQRSYYIPFSLCAKLSSRTKRDCRINDRKEERKNKKFGKLHLVYPIVGRQAAFPRERASASSQNCESRRDAHLLIPAYLCWCGCYQGRACRQESKRRTGSGQRDCLLAS